MAAGDTYIELGGTLAIASGKPATTDQAGFEAVGMTYDQIKGVLNIPQTGDTMEDVSEPTLEEGRVEHFFGAVDGGSIEVPVKHIEGDAGQAALLAISDHNAVYSFRFTDSDGTKYYKYGRVGPIRRRERTPNSFKAYIVPIVFNSPEVRVAPA